MHSQVSIHTVIVRITKTSDKEEIKIVFQLYKSSLVTQGRNLCVSAFLEVVLSFTLYRLGYRV